MPRRDAISRRKNFASHCVSSYGLRNDLSVRQVYPDIPAYRQERFLRDKKMCPIWAQKKNRLLE